MATLPMDRIGAGSAVSNALRQVGSVLGVAVLGTIVSSTYQHRIAPSLTALPAGVRDAAGTSAEATRHAAGTLGRPELVRVANDTFVHAMHIAAIVASGIVLVGAIVLTLAFRASRRTAEVEQEVVTVDA
jgi:hypothetical protein